MAPRSPEPSAALIRALKSRWPDLQFRGIAGPRMMAEGATSLFPMEKLSVRGYVAVLKSLRERPRASPPCTT